MPAPLARGLIFSISLLIAAGIAVYENPQVREWLDENRRKLAHSLHNLGDEIQPRPSHSRSRASDDVSTREDNSPEAAERRRLARAELYERARILEEKRQSLSSPKRRGSSFDDLVDDDGRLHNEKTPEAVSSATAPVQSEEGLRKRHAEAAGTAGVAGLAMGMAVADPFADEMGMDLTQEPEQEPEVKQESRESTATLQETAPASPLAIDTGAASAVGTEDEMLLDLTPTTSMAPSSFPFTPTSETEMQEELQQVPMGNNFQSVHEWAEASSASFYSAPESEASSYGVRTESQPNSQEPSLIDADERLSHADVMSEVGGVSTPGSWTEVGSMISDDDAV